jgi:hypothetical protein
MRRRPLALIVLLALGAVLSVLNHVRVVGHDDGWLVEVDGRPYDLMGALSERWRPDEPSCAAVQALGPASPAWARALGAARVHSPPDSHSAQLLSLHRMGAFYIAELAFDQLEPAVVLLRAAGRPGTTTVPSDSTADSDRLQILDQPLWSGSTEPWRPGPFIRRYLRSRAPDVPGALIDCFQPLSPGFARPGISRPGNPARP